MKTTLSKKELWLKLKNYHFDHLVPSHLMHKVLELFGGKDAATKAFAAKIAAKRGWKQDFALRAVEEYKKFIYLGMISNSPVTPSKVIDDVWHQHLQFTEGYREFCDNVINYQFDHNPELISVDEQTTVFGNQYLDTLALYESEFNVKPPEDIWAKPKFSEQILVSQKVARKKTSSTSNSYSKTDDDLPLYLWFNIDGSEHHTNLEEFNGFGGGSFGGGGSQGSYENKSEVHQYESPIHHDTITPDVHHHTESFHIDTPSHSDYGSGHDSGGHSCSSCSSSSCGGGD